MAYTRVKEDEQEPTFARLHPEVIRGLSTFTDRTYLFSILCGACIAGTGLLSNSAVSVVASMLVSPIMGPIVAIAAGLRYQFDRDVPSTSTGLLWHGIRNEFYSLVTCIVVGMLFGLVRAAEPSFLVENIAWPTAEMTSRGTANGLLIGVLVAIPSGFIVALSNVDNIVNPVVGVAISASLLPPAVNAGIMWAYGMVHPDHGYPWGEAGLYSFLLTLVNIGCIILVVTLMFVTGLNSASQKKQPILKLRRRIRLGSEDEDQTVWHKNPMRLRSVHNTDQ